MDLFDVTQQADGLVTLLAVGIFATGAIVYLICHGIAKGIRGIRSMLAEDSFTD